ncbi:hypothetical protein [Pantoea ananatis]|uniref:hypothetical protein n=1 Tax=Pantoea ananas TaxID=553 RepID=UPI001140DE85|nr:hypothetical protein [Pantoea ananatis]
MKFKGKHNSLLPLVLLMYQFGLSRSMKVTLTFPVAGTFMISRILLFIAISELLVRNGIPKTIILTVTDMAVRVMQILVKFLKHEAISSEEADLKSEIKCTTDDESGSVESRAIAIMLIIMETKCLPIIYVIELREPPRLSKSAMRIRQSFLTLLVMF